MVTWSKIEVFLLFLCVCVCEKERVNESPDSLSRNANVVSDVINAVRGNLSLPRVKFSKTVKLIFVKIHICITLNSKPMKCHMKHNEWWSDPLRF